MKRQPPVDDARDELAGGRAPGDPVIEASRAVLGAHARTFNLAGAFLPAARLDDAAVIYAFCRLVDDAVDEAPTIAAGEVALAAITEELRGITAPRPLIAALVTVAGRARIDLQVFEELIAGVASDSDTVRIVEDAELLRYCYRVAGTVGLMMCGVLGVAEPEALPYAVDLGIAMQLTNICRDVAEDAERGRIYLPTRRLVAAGIDPETLIRGVVDRRLLGGVVDDLLGLAERYYSSAERGMGYIPAGSRLAILIASRAYRAIGRRLQAQGSDPIRGRTIVPRLGKAAAILGAGAVFLRSGRRTRGGESHDPWLHRALAGLPGADPRAAALAGRLLELGDRIA